MKIYGGSRVQKVVLTNDYQTKKLILKNIFASFFEKDIKVFSELKDIKELRDLILLLGPRNGNLLDVTRLSSELGINRVKNYNYLEFLEGTFFLRLIPKFTHNIDRSVAGGKDEIAFEVKQKAIGPDLKKLEKIALQLNIQKYYLISNTPVQMDKVVYPWFF